MQPDQRFIHRGPDTCSDAEVLALVLGPRPEDLILARALLGTFGSLHAIARVPAASLLQVDGLGHRRALRLQAALEIGRRSLAPPDPTRAISSASDAEAVLGPPLRRLQVEELHALYLDRRRRPRAHRRLTRGTDGYTIVDPRQVFRHAVSTGASAVIMAHNHPSGDVSPSAQDRDVTRRVARAGGILGIPLLDHLVIAGAQDYVSLAAEGIVGEVSGIAPSVLASPEG